MGQAKRRSREISELKSRGTNKTWIEIYNAETMRPSKFGFFDSVLDDFQAEGIYAVTPHPDNDQFNDDLEAALIRACIQRVICPEEGKKDSNEYMALQMGLAAQNLTYKLCQDTLVSLRAGIAGAKVTLNIQGSSQNSEIDTENEDFKIESQEWYTKSTEQTEDMFQIVESMTHEERVQYVIDNFITPLEVVHHA